MHTGGFDIILKDNSLYTAINESLDVFLSRKSDRDCHGKYITTYLWNKAFLAKSVSQNPRKAYLEPYSTAF